MVLDTTPSTWSLCSQHPRATRAVATGGQKYHGHVPRFRAAIATDDFDRLNDSYLSEHTIETASPCTSQTLWEDNKHFYYASLFNPFVRDMANGTLPKHVFEEYISQDSHYLRVFEDALSTMHDLIQVEIGVDESFREEAGEKALTLLHSVEAELSSVHSGYNKSFEDDEMSWATKSYTRFLKKVHDDPKSSVAEILASLLPCFRLYAEIAQYLDANVLSCLDPDENHPYSHWIKEYASPKFLGSVKSAEWIFDNAVTRDARTTAQCQEYYFTSMEKELQFFGSHAMKCHANQQYDILVVDFDETCTQGDTISVIIEAAIEKSNLSQLEKQSREKKSKQLAENYIRARQALLQTLLPKGPDDGQVYGSPWLERFVHKLHKFDTSMNQVVIESGVLSGIPPESLKASSHRIQLHSNCVDTLKLAIDSGMYVVILSVNWSSEMIEHVLKRSGFAVNIVQNTDEIDLKNQNMIHIIANQLEFDSDGSTGQIRRICESALDKKQIFKQIMSRNRGLRKSMYIGDSITDIGPLAEASLGIIMGHNATLLNAVRVAGVEIFPIEAYLSYQSKAVYHTDSWKKVYGLLSGVTWCSERQKKRLHEIPRVLLISGSDSGGGAGLQADIKTCVSCGTFPTNAVSAVTVQNSYGVNHIHTIPARVLKDQINAIQSDIGSSCIKIGMLGSIENVKAVSEHLRTVKYCPPVILDPVLISSSGSSLAEKGLVYVLKNELLPIATMITPNISEASQLLDGMLIDSVNSMRLAAKKLHEFGPAYVLVKGGHCMDSHLNATDILYDGSQFVEFSKVFLDATNNHGTGCALSSAIASYIAKGETVVSAVSYAKEFVWRSMERSSGICLGSGDQKAMNLAHHVDNWQDARSNVRIPNDIDVSLYAVSSPQTTSQEKSDTEILDSIRAVVSGGASVIQIRDKISEGGHLTRLVSKIVRFCRPRGVKVIVNDRVDVCIASDACGVHVGQGDIPAHVVRQMIGPDKILGVSCKTVELALKAERDGADYLGCGAVFDTPTKKTSRRIGIEGVRSIRERVSIPVVAIGGLDDTNIEQTIMGSNCDGVAVVRAIFDAQDIKRATQHLKQLTDAALYRQKCDTLKAPGS